MPLHFKIDTMLRGADLAAFRDVMLDRGATVNDGIAWLKSRGLKASRGAIAGWRKSLVARSMLDVSEIIGLADEPAIRGKIAEIAQQLTGPDLHQLCVFAVFIANLRRASAACVARTRRTARRIKPPPDAPAGPASGEAATGGNLAA